MKKIIILTMFLAFVSASFGQQITPNQNWKESDYYKKSKKQKTAAWILTSAGTVGLLATLTADASQVTEGALITVISLGTEEPPAYKSYTVPYLLSTASLLSGIYLFIASSKNKKKAKAASVFIDMENARVLQGTVLHNQSFPSVGVKIHL